MCKNPRPLRRASAPPPPFPGEAGWVTIIYIGESELVEQFGQVTSVRYEFVPNVPKNIDRRDSVYILGPEFEVQ